MASESTNNLATIEELEKENRILRKKLERSEKTCLELEQTNQKKESLLRQVINELENSQQELEGEKRQLEETLLELKQTQSQLVQAGKMSSLGQLVAGVAHEINNPINFIHGNLIYIEEYAQKLIEFVGVYQEYYPNPVDAIQVKADEIDLEFLNQDLYKILKSIKLGTDRIRQIVLSLKNFSRMDEAEFKPVDIHAGIDSTLLILQHRLQETSEHSEIKVIREYGNLPLVECYAGQLNQVFMNILANAIDAIEENNTQSGQILIHTSVIDSLVQISISDNGFGMSKEVQNQIFNPFFTTKPVGKGTGMGMSISYQIITEKHQGKLDCFSILGVGTEFLISIPIHQPSYLKPHQEILSPEE